MAMKTSPKNRICGVSNFFYFFQLFQFFIGCRYFQELNLTYPRVQRKLILQLALRASCNQHLPARKSFLLARKKFFMVCRNLHVKHLSYSTFVILILRKIFACPSGKLSTEFTSPIAKSTSPGLSDTTFFAR